MAPGDLCRVPGRSMKRGTAVPTLSVIVTDERGRPVPAGGLARWLTRVAPARARGAVGIALVSDARVRALNLRYLGQDHATDVLSFPAGDSLSADLLAYRTDNPRASRLRLRTKSSGRLAGAPKARRPGPARGSGPRTSVRQWDLPGRYRDRPRRRPPAGPRCGPRRADRASRAGAAWVAAPARIRSRARSGDDGAGRAPAAAEGWIGGRLARSRGGPARGPWVVRSFGPSAFGLPALRQGPGGPVRRRGAAIR